MPLAEETSAVTSAVEAQAQNSPRAAQRCGVKAAARSNAGREREERKLVPSVRERSAGSNLSCP